MPLKCKAIKLSNILQEKFLQANVTNWTKKFNANIMMFLIRGACRSSWGMFMLTILHLLLSTITLVDGFSLHFEEHRAQQTTIVRDGNFDRKVDTSLMCWNVMIVHVTDLLSDTSKSAAYDFRLLAFFGLMSLIPKLWSSLSSRLTCETVMFLRFSQKYSNSNHNCML